MFSKFRVLRILNAGELDPKIDLIRLIRLATFITIGFCENEDEYGALFVNFRASF